MDSSRPGLIVLGVAVTEPQAHDIARWLMQDVDVIERDDLRSR
jgi:hypothetical protein